ncbi:hypothetical protein BV20DRAFT_966399 [Pilatotrama ljubarskyi]|nr:hypothetical protein BV20DRAFT_966399 [Pilatotrama ljubarskyi]
MRIALNCARSLQPHASFVRNRRHSKQHTVTSRSLARRRSGSRFSKRVALCDALFLASNSIRSGISPAPHACTPSLVGQSSHPRDAPTIICYVVAVHTLSLFFFSA